MPEDIEDLGSSFQLIKKKCQQWSVIDLSLERKMIIGTWNILKMNNWDLDYINMEVQAYIRIDNKGTGEFQFGLVSGQIQGSFKKDIEGVTFDFIWEGCDENDYVSGDGWIRAKDNENAEGEIRFISGEISLFQAVKVKLE